jgi:hypothetical protein
VTDTGKIAKHALRDAWLAGENRIVDGKIIYNPII